MNNYPDYIDDIIQDVFLSYITELSKGTKIENEKSWLTKVTVNKINDFFRKMSAEKSKVAELEKEYKQVSENDIYFKDDISDEKIEEEAENILNMLSHYEKELISDFYDKKIPQSIMAKERGISHANVRQQIFRLRYKIVKIIHEMHKDNGDQLE